MRLKRTGGKGVPTRTADHRDDPELRRAARHSLVSIKHAGDDVKIREVNEQLDAESDQETIRTGTGVRRRRNEEVAEPVQRQDNSPVDVDQEIAAAMELDDANASVVSDSSHTAATKNSDDRLSDTAGEAVPKAQDSATISHNGGFDPMDPAGDGGVAYKSDDEAWEDSDDEFAPEQAQSVQVPGVGPREDAPVSKRAVRRAQEAIANAYEALFGDDAVDTVKYGNESDLIPLMASSTEDPAIVERHLVSFKTSNVNDSTGKYVGNVDELFPAANRQLTAALKLRKEINPGNSIDYEFKHKNAPGQKGSDFEILWPATQNTSIAVLGQPDPGVLSYFLKDEQGRTQVKIYPGVLDADFSFDNPESIRKINEWRPQFRNRKAGVVRYAREIDQEWSEAENKFLKMVFACILKDELRKGNADSADVLSRINWKMVELKFDAHFSANPQSRGDKLVQEACDQPPDVPDGEKKLSRRRKIPSPRLANVMTCDEIEERATALLDVIERFSVTNEEQASDNWAKYVKPKKAPKNQSKLKHGQILNGIGQVEEYISKTKAQKIKDAKDAGKNKKGKGAKGGKSEAADNDDDEATTTRTPKTKAKTSSTSRIKPAKFKGKRKMKARETDDEEDSEFVEDSPAEAEPPKKKIKLSLRKTPAADTPGPGPRTPKKSPSCRRGQPKSAKKRPGGEGSA